MNFSLTRSFSGADDILSAVSEDGEIIAQWIKSRSAQRRDASNSYDAHRISKGDRVRTSHSFTMTGQTEEVLAACLEQRPQPFLDAKWGCLRHDPAKPVEYEFQLAGWVEHEFLSGLIGGCAWYGNTPPKTVAAIKRAQTKELKFILER